MLKYKINCLECLKEKGYNTYILYKERHISQSSIQKMREGKVIGIIELDKLCKLLEMQPGDIIMYVPD